MSEERPSLQVAAPPNVLPSTNTINGFILEKQAAHLVNNGSIIHAAVIISSVVPSTTPVKFRNVVYAQRGITIKLQEALDIISKITVSPPPILTLGNNKYENIVTSIQEKTYYCKNTNTKIGSGLIIAKLDRIIVIALYSSPILPVEAISYVEGFVQDNFM